jgi:hypothetical protein
MTRVEPLSDFLNRTNHGPSEPYLAQLQTQGRSLGLKDFDAAASLARFRDYIARYYEGVHPVDSFVDGTGHVIDCVPFNQQPAARFALASGQHLLKNAPPPAAVPGATHKPASRQEPFHCPPGSVMIRRLTLEDLIPFGTLENYLHKHRNMIE